MKKDDVLNILTAMKKSYLSLGIPDPEAVEALDMAMNAVKAEPCEDAISRQGEQMDFPDTFEEFAEQYQIIDKEEVYTNGIELIPVFRVKQWLVHIKTGHWISLDDFRGKYNENGFMCSECNEHSDYEANYCPSCGAKMVEPQERVD